MITRKAAAALAAGCPVVVRPASETPFSALALAELGERAGVPAGAFSVVTGAPEPIVGELCANPLVRALSFTGSTEIGKRLIRQSADTVKRVSMELGGHAPFILFPDVDLDEGVEAAIAAKFQTSGQDCLAANRIFVHERIYEAFVHRFAKRARALKVGNGFEPGVAIGPLMHERAVRKCEAHVADAVQRGARLLAGGRRHAAGRWFYEPTVLADADERMAIFREETFGPVAAVTRFADEAEVVRRANSTGLWARRLSLHARPRPHLPADRRARLRHGGGQLREDDRPPDPLRRRPGIRPRPRRRPSRHARIHRPEICLRRLSRGVRRS